MDIRNVLSTRDAQGRQGDMAGKIAARMQEIRKAGGLKREASVGAIDVDARTVELSFSSEIEYERWFGIEILDHSDGSVRMDRLNNAAPVLWMHNWDDQRGVVQSATIEDRKGRAVLRFSRSPAGDQLFQDIQDGIITKVSVGYLVNALRFIEEREGGTDVYLVTDWEPFEISMVSVPADDTVGVGRSAEIPQEETPKNAGDNAGNIDNPNQRNKGTMEKILRDAAGNLVRAMVDEAGNITQVLEVLEKAGTDVQTARAAGQAEEQARVRALTELGRAYNASDLAMTFIGEGKTADDLRRALLDKHYGDKASKPVAEQERSASIGMSEADVNRYSLFNAVRALANPNDARAQAAAKFEIECSAEAQRKYGRESRGIMIPQDVLARAFNAGGAGNTPTGAQTGSGLVDTTFLAGSFIEMLRNRTTIMRKGTVMGGLVGNVDIPRQTDGATAYWIGEGDDATEGTPVIGQIGLTPKTVAAYTDITRRLMMQSTPDAEGIVRRDLLNALGQAIDRAGYYGSGTGNEPRGIKNYTGLNAVDFAAANPTFPELVAMETAIAADNADVNSMGYVANAKFRGYAKSTVKFASAGSATIWEPGNSVNGYGCDITNQIADGDVFFGNFADFIIGLWGGLDMIVDTASLSKSGGTRIVVFQDIDFVLRRVESLCYGNQNVA